MFDTNECNVNDGGVSYVRIKSTDHLLEEFDKGLSDQRKMRIGIK